MSPIYLNQPPSSSHIPFQEFKGDQLILGQIHDLATSSSSSLSYPNLEKIHSYDETLALEYSRHPREIKVNKVLSHDKINDLGQVFQSSSSWPQNMEDSGGCDSYDYSPNHITHDKMEIVGNSDQQRFSRKWKPSKVRIMQKMIANSKQVGEQKLHHNLDQQQNNISRNTSEGNNNSIRVCSDCHTTTTPLWRSGPQGPKSLCNACGIRQRKARRAAMAAAETARITNERMNVASMAMEVTKTKANQEDHHHLKDREFDNKSHPLPLKKRGKTINVARNYVENNSHNNNHGLMMSSSKDYITTTTSQRVFPRDEEEGAILLMALSCGLACSS